MTKRKPLQWFALDQTQPLFFFAGIWTRWEGTRGSNRTPRPGQHELFGDDASEPLPVTPEGIDALLDIWPVFEAFQREVLGPHLVLDAEKTASRPR